MQKCQRLTQVCHFYLFISLQIEYFWDYVLALGFSFFSNFTDNLIERNH